MKLNKIFCAAALCAALAGISTMAQAYDKTIIAHRGASGYLPEHTLEAKALAYEMGVDYLEQDLAMTKDNQLVVVHDHYLDRISDVAEKFPNRHRKDGRYYVIDFTLPEIKSLNFTEGFDIKDGKKVQIYPDRFPMGKSTFKIHTFAEEIEFIQGLNKTLGRDVGLYVETKAPWFHKQEGKDISKATLEVLKKYGYTNRDSKVYFQTFDYPDLKYVKDVLEPKMGMDLKTVILVTDENGETYEKTKDGKWKVYDFAYLLNPKNFKEIAKYADGYGVDYHLLIDEKNSKKGDIKVNNLAKEAHEAGMIVHPWTIRKDALPPYANNVDEVFDAVLYKAGADGVFTDFPDLGVAFVKKHSAEADKM